MSEKFDIYSKIFYRDVEKFVRYLCLLVLRHQMRVSNYFVNSFYSVHFQYSTVPELRLCLILHYSYSVDSTFSGYCLFSTTPFLDSTFPGLRLS
jgi:hypothetical protein